MVKPACACFFPGIRVEETDKACRGGSNTFVYNKSSRIIVVGWSQLVEIDLSKVVDFTPEEFSNAIFQWAGFLGWDSLSNLSRNHEQKSAQLNDLLYVSLSGSVFSLYLREVCSHSNSQLAINVTDHRNSAMSSKALHKSSVSYWNPVLRSETSLPFPERGRWVFKSLEAHSAFGSIFCRLRRRVGRVSSSDIISVLLRCGIDVLRLRRVRLEIGRSNPL